MVLASIGYVFIRIKMNKWGTSKSDADASMPGDWLIGDKLRATRAVTIFKDVDSVWPWINQLGRGAGYYTCDFLLNGNRNSANYIIPDINSNPSAGEKNPKLGSVEVVTDKHFVTWIRRDVHLPFASISYRFTYMLIPHGLGACRLVLRSTIDWTGKIGIVYGVVLEQMTFLFSIIQLKNLKNLVESYETRLDSGNINRYSAGQHQADTITFVENV